jgi:competence protein ComEA
MEAAPAPVGVAAAAPAPPPGWPDATQWVHPGGDLPVALPNAAPPAWPRPAQWATALLLALALGLLAWHAYGARRGGTRPTTLEPDAAVDPLDLNRADHAQLLQLPGVGDGLARRIEAYRREHNGFRSADDLRRVRGIGPALLERLRPLVHVEPYEGGEEAEPAPSAARPPPPAPQGPRAGAIRNKKEGLTGPVDINRASAAELQRLPGIGPKLSGRIVEARAQRPFRSVDELRRVRGIGAKTLERLRPHVTVGDGGKPVARDD